MLHIVDFSNAWARILWNNRDGAWRQEFMLFLLAGRLLPRGHLPTARESGVHMAIATLPPSYPLNALRSLIERTRRTRTIPSAQEFTYAEEMLSALDAAIKAMEGKARPRSSSLLPHAHLRSQAESAV